METAIVSLVCVAILLIGTVTTMFTSFKAATTVSESLKEMEEQSAEIRRTDISADIPYYSSTLHMWVQNDGQTNLAHFEKWDIIAEYEASGTKYLVYLTKDGDTDPENNEWALYGIYLPDGSNEVYDPGILNPGEEARIEIQLYPAPSRYTTARIITSTENGVTAQCQITRP
jgi:hypothetical protein